LGGVTYTARIKTGYDGVLDLDGNTLKSEEGEDWYAWSFSTMPNFVPSQTSAPGAENLSCHVFQTVRDVPLIAGKPAVARIYAHWKKHPEVHDDAQVKEFVGRIALIEERPEIGPIEIATDFVRFVQPDLWASRGVDKAKAEHTGELFFLPRAGLASSLRVKLVRGDLAAAGHGHGLGEQQPPAVARVADAIGNAGQPSEQRGVESILQKNRGVEVFGAQFRGQAQLPGQAGVAPGVLVGQETVAEILASVEIGDPRARQNDDLRAGTDAPDLAQRGNRDHRVTQPVRRSYENFHHRKCGSQFRLAVR
jgi:hypothetical protein